MEPQSSFMRSLFARAVVAARPSLFVTCGGCFSIQFPVIFCIVLSVFSTLLIIFIVIVVFIDSYCYVLTFREALSTHSSYWSYLPFSFFCLHG